MMGKRAGMQAALFYEFDRDRHVPSDHLLRAIDRFIHLFGIQAPALLQRHRPPLDRSGC